MGQSRSWDLKVKAHGKFKNEILRLLDRRSISCYNPEKIKFLTRLRFGISLLLEHIYLNTAFRFHFIAAIPYTQMRDNLFQALLETLNVKFQIILRSCLWVV